MARICNNFESKDHDPLYCKNCDRAKPMHTYVFWHECEEPGCDTEVEYDDEPKCFTHSPDEGSSVLGYSAREQGVQS